MPTILLETTIHAPIAICFDLSRSLELHMLSTSKTHEKAVGGRLSGLISLNETVTWRAKHFGIYQHLSVRITQMNKPFSFTDEMIKGAFKIMKHQHTFETFQNDTIMRDHFYFESPLGILGHLFNYVILTNYMRTFLIERNRIIKLVAENGDYKKYI